MRPLLKNLSKLKRLLIIVGLIPIICYCCVIIHFSSNVPYYDDFYWAMDYLATFFQKTAFTDKLKTFFIQHNQHRFVYFRAIILVFFHFENQLNFKYIILFGNICLFGLFGLYGFLFKRLSVSWIYFLPLPFIFFQFQFVHNSITTYGVPNLSIIFFSVLTFFYVCFESQKHSCLILVFGLLSTFSNGNGILVFPIAIILLILQQRFRLSIYAAIAYALCMIVYFCDFKMNSGALSTNADTFLFIFQFLGAIFLTDINVVSLVLSMASVTGILIYYAVFFFRHFQYGFKSVNDKVLLFCMGVFMFVVGSAVMTALFRSRLKVDLPDWYKNYSVLFITTIYILMINFQRKSNLKGVVLGIFFIYGVVIWYKSAETRLPVYQYMKSTFEADVTNFHRYKHWSFLTAQEGFPFYERQNKQTNRFIEKGWYRLPETPLDNLTFDEKKCEMTKFRIEKSDNQFATLVHFDMSEVKDSDREQKERYGYIVNDSSNQVYFFGLIPSFNGIRGIFKQKSLFFDKGYFDVKYSYYKEALPKGNYRVGVVFINKNNEAEWKLSDQRIKVDNFFVIY